MQRQTPSIRTESQSSVSLYTDREATDEDYKQALQRLTIAFTLEDKQATAEFMALLASRCKAHRFTATRLRDAVNHVMDNFRFKTLNIADVVGYDRRAKTYTPEQFARLSPAEQEWCAPLTDGDGNRVKFLGKALWVDVHDCMGTPIGERAMAYINAKARERAARERAEQEEAARRGRTMSHAEWLAKKQLRDG